MNRPEDWARAEMIDVIEAARRLGRSENAVRCLIKKGKIGARRVDSRVMIESEEIERFKQGSQDHTQPLRLLGNSTLCA